ncbi:hypothetical protein I79_008972 [Cricetulus griseus]|uniref:Uncharacterized protein n=1 Tax=Cricetulus griseus TaxID=10029 RepID=G3HEI8_CRIGR|nr:hypothetical protein I79_008972 [Cricetulus griseus]
MQTWIGAATYDILGSQQLEPGAGQEGLRTRKDCFLPWCYSGAGACTWLVSDSPDAGRAELLMSP